MNERRTHTLMVDDETYLCHSGPLPSSWQVLVHKDGNEAAYRPVILASWDKQRQQSFDKFLLLPAPGCGEGPLIQISIYHPLESAAGAPQNTSTAFPDMVCRCRIPATIQQEPATQRILVTLLCTLEARPEEYRIAVTLPTDAETTFQHLERAGSQARAGGAAFLKIMEKQEEQLLAWARRDPRDEVYLYRVAAKLFLGLQAVQERKFGKAEGHFRQAQDFDGADESEAYFFLALTLLWQRKAREASGIFYDDCVDRCVRLPAFFSLWSDLCRYNSLAAYLAELKRTHADQLDSDEDEEDWLDEEDQREVTPDAKAIRLTQTLLESVEYHYKMAEDEEGPFSAGNSLLSAAFCFLGQDYRGCLKHLQGLSSSSFTGFSCMWAVWFWKAMAYLELGRYREAKKFLEQAIAQRSPLESIPPVLVNAILWGLERFFPWIRSFWQAMAHAARGSDEHASERLDAALAQGMPPLLMGPLRWLKPTTADPASWFACVVRPLLIAHDHLYGEMPELTPPGGEPSLPSQALQIAPIRPGLLLAPTVEVGGGEENGLELALPGVRGPGGSASLVFVEFDAGGGSSGLDRLGWPTKFAIRYADTPAPISGYFQEIWIDYTPGRSPVQLVDLGFRTMSDGMNAIPTAGRDHLVGHGSYGGRGGIFWVDEGSGLPVLRLGTTIRLPSLPAGTLAYLQALIDEAQPGVGMFCDLCDEEARRPVNGVWCEHIWFCPRCHHISSPIERSRKLIGGTSRLCTHRFPKVLGEGAPILQA